MCVILHFKTGTTFILHIEAEDNKRKGRLVFLFFLITNGQQTYLGRCLPLLVPVTLLLFAYSLYALSSVSRSQFGGFSH